MATLRRSVFGVATERAERRGTSNGLGATVRAHVVGATPAFDPHRRYQAGDLVHPDVYGCVNGYFYDFVRSTVVGGDPTAQQRELMEGLLALAQHVTTKMRSGACAAATSTRQGSTSPSRTGWVPAPRCPSSATGSVWVS